MSAAHWLDMIGAKLTEVAEHYDRAAPTVTEWANDLYIRINEAPASVALPELLMVERFVEEGAWMQPNYAANAVYHLLDRLGRDTAGQAGF